MTAFDAIVIGGGIAGISAAAQLAGHMSVLVLEAEDRTGRHSTGRSAAIFIRNYGNSVLRALNAASAEALESPGETFDGPLLSARGEMLLATPDELEALEGYCNGAVGLERLTASQAVELVPILRLEPIAGAVIEWDAQDIDVDRMMAGYARQLRRQGGQITTGARVSGLERNGCVWQVRAGEATYSAPLVVNAAGAWAADIATLAGAKALSLTPMRRSAALLPAPHGQDVMRWPLFGSVAETWYAKPTGGKLMVSPADEDPVEPHDAWPDDMVLAEGLHRYELAVTEPVTRVETSWAGLRTFTADRTPVVGFDPVVEGFFWLAGQGGYGVQTAPALAALTEALVTRSTAVLDENTISGLDPKRFRI